MTQKPLKDMNADEERAAYPIATFVIRWFLFPLVAAIPLLLSVTAYVLYLCARYSLRSAQWLYGRL
jgi:hypothetical protein